MERERERKSDASVAVLDVACDALACIIGLFCKRAL